MIAHETDDGYSWTLVSRLGDMLQELERIYGPRDKSYTILGIEFEKNGPQLWYPGNRKDIIIQLSLEAQYDLPMALYQLAHEAVHLLAPTGGSHSTVFEEGFATVFAWDYTMKVTGVDFRERSGKKYRLAGTIVEQFLAEKGQLDSKSRAYAERTFDRDFATVSVHDLSRYIEAQTQPADML